jgi:HAE1 family hydrophobic/amphiphilic exporter-1/multidrug efflux pump
MTLFLQKVSLVVTPHLALDLLRKQRFFVRLSLKNLMKESCTESTNKLTKWTNSINAKHLLQQPTITVDQQTWWFTDTIYYSNSKFIKLEEAVVYGAVDNDPTFSMSDVNLKFNKPELNVTIDP